MSEKERFGIMKNKEDFIKFYDEYYGTIINKFFKKELKKYNKIRLGYILKNIVCFLLPFFFYFFIDLEEDLKVFVTFCLFIAIFFLFLLDLKLLKNKYNKFLNYVNREIYCNLLIFITNDQNIHYYPNTVLALNDFNQMNLFNLDLLYYDGKNLTSSFFLNKSFVFCDITLSIIKERLRQEVYYEESINTKFIYNIHEEYAKHIFDGLYYDFEDGDHDFVPRGGTETLSKIKFIL